jgi:hypothetical protein
MRFNARTSKNKRIEPMELQNPVLIQSIFQCANEGGIVAGKHEIIAHRMEEYVALKIEHQDDDNELLKYLRKQAGLYQD